MNITTQYTQKLPFPNKLFCFELMNALKSLKSNLEFCSVLSIETNPSIELVYQVSH